MPKVSVIIPVYNTENYLRKCLNSVCRQTLSDIEIICINDCSPDNCSEILKEYAAKDNRIKIIDFKENKGAAVARNTGIDAAKGEYIGFIDSDDFVDLDFYEKLYNRAIKTGADAVKGNYKDASSGFVDYSLNKKVQEDKNNFSFAYCSAIFKRSVIIKNSVKFPALCDIEDPVFTYKFALQANKIEILDNAFINIVKRSDSQTTALPTFQRIKDRIEGLKKIISLAEDNSVSKNSYCFTLSFWFWSVFINSIKAPDTLAKKYLLDMLTDLCSKIKNQDLFWEYLNKQNSFFSQWLENKDLTKLSEFEKYSRIYSVRNILKKS